MIKNSVKHPFVRPKSVCDTGDKSPRSSTSKLSPIQSSILNPVSKKKTNYNNQRNRARNLSLTTNYLSTQSSASGTNDYSNNNNKINNNNNINNNNYNNNNLSNKIKIKNNNDSSHLHMTPNERNRGLNALVVPSLINSTTKTTATTTATALINNTTNINNNNLSNEPNQSHTITITTSSDNSSRRSRSNSQLITSHLGINTSSFYMNNLNTLSSSTSPSPSPSNTTTILLSTSPSTKTHHILNTTSPINSPTSTLSSTTSLQQQNKGHKKSSSFGNTMTNAIRSARNKTAHLRSKTPNSPIKRTNKINHSNTNHHHLTTRNKKIGIGSGGGGSTTTSSKRNKTKFPAIYRRNGTDNERYSSANASLIASILPGTNRR